MCRQAPEFIPWVQKIELSDVECNDDLLEALLICIISQQLSGKVAERIYARFEALFDGKITPEKLLAQTDATLRACGLSGQKAKYVRGVAEAAANGQINFAKLHELSDDEVVAELVKLKGVGTWTAEMMLIFSLGRTDVLSFKDLGIRRGLMKINRLNDLTEADFARLRQRYSPYGTLASLYLWRGGDQKEEI